MCLFRAADYGSYACFDVNGCANGASHLVENDVVKILHVGAPRVSLRLFGHSHVRLGEVGASLSQLQTIADAVAGTVIVAGGPVQCDGVTCMAGLFQSGQGLVSRDCQLVASFVQFGVVLVRASGEGKADEKKSQQTMNAIYISFHIDSFFIVYNVS